MDGPGVDPVFGQGREEGMSEEGGGFWNRLFSGAGPLHNGRDGLSHRLLDHGWWEGLEGEW
jgi:hypothetical protein